LTRSGGGDRVLAAKFHSGKLGASLNSHQIPVAGIVPATEQRGEERTAAGRQYGAGRPHRPCLVSGLTLHAARTGHGTI
jgi:hypothetical protein